MSNLSSVSNAAAGAADKPASASQPIKQGRWGWPLRSAVDVNKASAAPSGAASGSPAIPSSVPVVSGLKSRPPAEPDKAPRKLPALPPTPKPARVDSAKIARILDTETEQIPGNSSMPPTSGSPKRKNQPGPLPSQPTIRNPDKSVSVGASDPKDIEHAPNTKPPPPVLDLKLPRRTWVPPARIRTIDLDSTNQEYPLISSVRGGSRSSSSTRRSSQNLTPSRIRLPASPVFGDIDDAAPNGGNSPPNPEGNLGFEDRKETRERTTAKKASFPSSPASGNPISDQLAGELDGHDPRTARILEAVGPLRESAEQRPSIRDSPPVPTGFSGTVVAPDSQEAAGVEDLHGPSPPLSPPSSIRKIVSPGSRSAEKRHSIPTSDAPDIPKGNSQNVQREMGQNPLDHDSIFYNEDARQVPTEVKFPRLEPNSVESEMLPVQLENQTPRVSGNEFGLHENEPEPSVLKKPENNEESLPGLSRDDISSGTITPSEPVEKSPERSLPTELALLDSHAASQAPSGIGELSSSMIQKARDEETPPSGTERPPTNDQSSLGPELSPEGAAVGSVAVPPGDVGLVDFPSSRIINLESARTTSSIADDSVTDVGASSAAPMGLETTLPRPVPRPEGTEQTEELTQPNLTKESEDGASFKTVESHPVGDGAASRLLDLTIGLQVSQADIQDVGNGRDSREISEPETVRTVTEIPLSQQKSKRLPIPKIFVQNPSDATDIDIPSFTRKESAGKGIAINAPRSLESATAAAEGRRPSTAGGPLGRLIPDAGNVPEENEEAKTPPLKKRKLYLRKVRNAAARKVILEITLGRELAKQTKPMLRRLAKGEYVTFEDPVRR